MIKTVIFDLGKTLIPFDFERGYRGLRDLCGYETADIRKRIGATDLVNRFEAGHVQPAEFVERLSGTLGIQLEYERFCEIWSSIFLPEPLIPECMLAALGARYRLLLLSNTNAIHFEGLLRNYPLLRRFDDFILSFEVKALKPEPAIYREAIRRARCAPGECFFTDDVAAYVEAARREGMQGVPFESRAQLENAMREHGIEW